MAELASPDEKAWNSALRLLEAGDKSRQELKERLIQKRFDHELVEQVLDRLENSGFLNDKVFAARLADKLEARKASQRKVAFEMRRRGVPAEYMQEELARLELGQEDRLYQACRKQWNRLNRLDPQVRTRRIFGSLARQGFDSEPIRLVLERIIHEEINKGDEQSYVDYE